MKQVFKQSILTAVAILILGLSGCVSEFCIPRDPDYNGERAVSLRIVQSTNTRGISRPVCDREPLVLNTGHIYLVTATGAIMHHFEIVATAAEANFPTGNRILRADLDAGVTIHSVPGNVREVVIIGNTPNTTHTGNVDSELISSRLIHITEQYNAWNVNLFGRATLQPTGNNSLVAPYLAIWEGEVHLAPNVARFELASIVASGTIVDFTVQGIFIDRYFQQAQINSTLNSDHIISHGTEAAEFFLGQNDYTLASNFALFDWNVSQEGVREGMTLRPYGISDITCTVTSIVCNKNHTDVPNVWSYQVFARDYGVTTTPTTTPPSIILRLSSVEFADGTIVNEPRFVTVSSFRNVNTGTLIEGIRASNVYRIPVIVFDDNDLSPRPNDLATEIEVDVILSEWEREVITPGIPFRQPDPWGMAITRYENHLFNLAPATGGSGNISYIWQMQRKENGVWLNWENVTIFANAYPELDFSAPAHNEFFPFGQCPDMHLEDSIFVRRIAIDNVTRRQIVTEPALLRVVDAVRIIYLLWARTNIDPPGVFAEEPHHAGTLFQWNSRIAWSGTGAITTWNTATETWVPTSWTNVSNPGEYWYRHNDPCPPGWRVPTNHEFNSLIANGNQHYVRYGVQGRLFGAYPNQIFLPMVNHRRHNNGNIENDGIGWYWTTSHQTAANSAQAFTLQFNQQLGVAVAENGHRRAGKAVRCIVHWEDPGAPPEQHYIHFNPSSFPRIPSDGGTVTFTVTASRSWTATITDSSNTSINGIAQLSPQNVPVIDNETVPNAVIGGGMHGPHTITVTFPPLAADELGIAPSITITGQVNGTNVMTTITITQQPRPRPLYILTRRPGYWGTWYAGRGNTDFGRNLGQLRYEIASQANFGPAGVMPMGARTFSMQGSPNPPISQQFMVTVGTDIYLANSATFTAEEGAQVRAWLAANPRRVLIVTNETQLPANVHNLLGTGWTNVLQTNAQYHFILGNANSSAIHNFLLRDGPFTSPPHAPNIDITQWIQLRPLDGVGSSLSAWPATFVPIIRLPGHASQVRFGIDPVNRIVFIGEPEIFGSDNRTRSNWLLRNDNRILVQNLAAWILGVATYGDAFQTQVNQMATDRGVPIFPPI